MESWSRYCITDWLRPVRVWETFRWVRAGSVPAPFEGACPPASAAVAMLWARTIRENKQINKRKFAETDNCRKLAELPLTESLKFWLLKISVRGCSGSVRGPREVRARSVRDPFGVRSGSVRANLGPKFSEPKIQNFKNFQIVRPSPPRRGPSSRRPEPGRPEGPCWRQRPHKLKFFAKNSLKIRTGR